MSLRLPKSARPRGRLIAGSLLLAGSAAGWLATDDAFAQGRTRYGQPSVEVNTRVLESLGGGPATGVHGGSYGGAGYGGGPAYSFGGNALPPLNERPASTLLIQPGSLPAGRTPAFADPNLAAPQSSTSLPMPPAGPTPSAPTTARAPRPAPTVATGPAPGPASSGVKAPPAPPPRSAVSASRGDMPSMPAVPRKPVSSEPAPEPDQSTVKILGTVPASSVPGQSPDAGAGVAGASSAPRPTATAAASPPPAAAAAPPPPAPSPTPAAAPAAPAGGPITFGGAFGRVGGAAPPPAATAPAAPSAPATPPPAATQPAPQPQAAAPQPAAAPPPAPAPQQVAALPPGPAGSIALPFETGNPALNAEAERQLAALATRLTGNQERVQINAYASGDSAAASKRLALSRALAVRSYLTDRGIASTRIDVRAIGQAETGEKDRVDVLPANR